MSCPGNKRCTVPVWGERKNVWSILVNQQWVTKTCAECTDLSWIEDVFRLKSEASFFNFMPRPDRYDRLQYVNLFAMLNYWDADCSTPARPLLGQMKMKTLNFISYAPHCHHAFVPSLWHRCVRENIVYPEHILPTCKLNVGMCSITTYVYVTYSNQKSIRM